MNADVLTTKVTDGIAVINLGSAKRIYFDAKMGGALTEALDGFEGDPNVRVVIVTDGAPGYFIRHFTIAALIDIAQFERMRSYQEKNISSPSRSIEVDARSAKHA